MLAQATRQLFTPGARRPFAPGAQTLIQRAIAILRRYGTDAHIYLPGVGMMNGLTAANYLDSAGTTVGTVDQPVGLVLDAVGSLGVELVTNGGPFVSTSGWSVARASVSVVSSALRVTATAAYANANSTIATISGRRYTVTVAMSALSAAKPVGVYAGTNSFTADLASAVMGSSAGSYTLSFVATGSTSYIFFQDTGAFVSGDYFDLAGVSVREVTGIAASQPTTSAKPILRRGAVNLLTYSNAATNAAWIKNGATNASNDTTVNLPGFSEAFFNTRTASVVAGDKWTGAFVLSGSGTVYISVARHAGGAYEETALKITLTATPTIYVVTHTLLAAQTAMLAAITRGADGTATTVTFGGGALFQGTYTAQQIQVLGGIPLTTTAPASTALGPYWWDTTGGKTLVATFPAGNESVTVIDAKSTGQVTLTGQNVVGAYNVSKQFGPEVVVNGDNEAATFSIGTMQANNTTASKVAAVGGRSGFVLLANSSISTSVSHQYNTQGTVLEANKSYQITMDMYVPTGGVGACRVFDNSDGSFFSLSMTTKDAWVTVSVVRPAKATAWQLGIGNNIPEIITSGLPSFYLDNISVKEVVSDVNGKIIVNGALTTPELTLLQSYANKMAGL